MEAKDVKSVFTKSAREVRRSIGIPKGFLNYAVLRILHNTPMSGSELMDEIKKWTGWRPSPGSIYPLLGKFREGGNIELIDSEEPGLKRFTLTEKGNELLKEYKTRREVFRRKFHSIWGMWLKIYSEMDEDLYQANIRLFEAVEQVTPRLKGDKAKEDTAEVRSILVEAAEEIEKVISRLEAEKEE
ncbi:MAG: PadR family transcriptional regulator [Candidatus Bathyarchaeia archaeon]